MLPLSKLLAPSSAETRQLVLRLRKLLGWSRAQLASFLGVSRHTLRRWETGERNPCAAARKLIWLANMFIFHPKELTTSFDLATWGKLKEENPPDCVQAKKDQ